MRIYRFICILALAIILVGCNSGKEYLPCSTLIVSSRNNEVVLELKLDNVSDWDRVSKCKWKVDGREIDAEGKTIALSLDKSSSHVVACSLYVGKNLWYSIEGIYIPKDTLEGNNVISIEIESDDVS